MTPASRPAVGQQPAGDPIIVIEDITLIDVVNSRALPHQTITITGERIKRIDPADKAKIADGAQVIAGNGLFALPGLFDAHVHFTPSPETFGPMMLANGVTAMRDTGADTDTILDLRQQSRQRGAMLPQIICTGAIIDGDPPVWPFSEPCDTPEEARAAVRKLKDAGVDMIKVYSLLKPDVYRAALDEAKALKIKVTGHVPNAITLDEALQAGQDCIEHLMGFERMLVELSGKPDDERQGIWPGLSGWLRLPDIDPAALRQRLEAIARSGVTLCPTTVVMQGVGAAADAEKADKDKRMAYVPATLRAFWGGGTYSDFAPLAASVAPHMRTVVGELHRAGAPLMIGTDLANPYVFAGFSVHDEMRNFAEAGIAPIDVLRSATIIPARFCGIDDDLGSIDAGKLASIVLVRADPLADITNASQIEAVFIRGVHHDRAALDKMLAGVREFVVTSAPAPAAAVELTLPGEVIARGRYVMKFNGRFDAGVEDFLITQDADGYHIKSYSQPQGGWASPSVVTVHFNQDFAFTSALMQQQAKKPVESTYELKDGSMHASATIDGAAEPPQVLAMPERGIVTSSMNAGDFAIFGAMRNMNVDERREMTAVGFGMGGWRVASVPYVITRKADEEVALPDGTKIKTRHYASTITNQGMEFNIDTWIDDRGVMVRSRMRAPFGMIETALEKAE
jgi:imidazolonepropionase-like amidohydrolase